MNENEWKLHVYLGLLAILSVPENDSFVLWDNNVVSK